MCEIHTHTHESRSKTQTHFITKYLYSRPDDVTSLGTSSREFCFFHSKLFFVSFFGIEIVGERWSVQKRESGIKLKRSRAWTEKKKYIFLHLNILSFCYQMNPKQQSQTIDDQRYAEILNSVESFIFLILFRSRLDYRVTSFIFKKKKGDGRSTRRS